MSPVFLNFCCNTCQCKSVLMSINKNIPILANASLTFNY